MKLFQETYYSNTEENRNYEISVVSSVGDREEQQDCSGYVLNCGFCLAILCDGMGGHFAGRKASYTAARYFCELAEALRPEHYPDSREFMRGFLSDAAEGADREIALLSADETPANRAGTTLAAVFIHGRDLNWISVGDTRIYLWRDGGFARITQDHNYGFILNNALKNGEISEDEYRDEVRMASALVSFLGIDGLPLKDANEKPLVLQPGDRILLMTDGLYRLVNDHEIDAATRHNDNIQMLTSVLDDTAREKAAKTGAKRDNTTLMVIRIK